MPVQKGKRNKNRPRGKSRPAVAAESTTRQSGASGARPARQRRTLWQGPPWFNAALGVFMLVVGVLFFALPEGKGVDIRQKLIFLAGYILLGGFYLFRAYRGYRRQPR
jgi:hypothetical protein